MRQKGNSMWRRWDEGNFANFLGGRRKREKIVVVPF